MRKIMQTLLSIFPAHHPIQNPAPALVSWAKDSFAASAPATPASPQPLQPPATGHPKVGTGPLIMPINTVGDYGDFSTPAGRVVNQLSRCETIGQQVAVFEDPDHAAGLAALRDYSMCNIMNATASDMETICALLAQHCPAMEAVFFSEAPLSPEALGRLGALANLHSVSIRRCALVDGALEALAGCTQLESFQLDTNAEPVGLPAVLAGMPGLQALSLVLPGVDVDTVSVVRRMAQLRELHLDAAAPMALPELKDLPAAQQLLAVALGNVGKGYDLSWLSQCANLQILSLCGEGVDDEAFAALAGKLPSLEKLDVSYCALGDSGVRTIATFNALRKLSCSDSFSPSSVTDAGFAALATLPNLKKLYFDRAPIGDAGAEALLRAPQRLKLRISAKRLSAVVRQRVLQETGDLWSLEYARHTDAGKRAISEDQAFCEAHGLLPTEGITHLPMRSCG